MAAPSTHPRADRHVLRFSPPWAVIAAVSFVTTVTLGYLLLPPLGPGPTGNASPTTSAAPTADPTDEVTPSASASASTASPSPSEVPGETPDPTTPPAPAWAGIRWSDPVTPLYEINLWDIVPWRDGYAAAGLVRGQPAFLASPDGLNWHATFTIEWDWATALGDPWHLVTDGDRLFAITASRASDAAPHEVTDPPLVLASEDGATWTVFDSPSWQAAWSGRVLFDVAMGPDGLVAIGNATTGAAGERFTDPIVVWSSDGLAWETAALGAMPDNAVLWDLVARPDGYVMLGGLQSPDSAVGVGTPAAWWSADGRRWERAEVQGAVADDNHFEPRTAFSAADGLVARTQVLSAGGPPELRAWLSTDGRSWQRATDLFVEIPSGLMASNGDRLVAFATDADWTPLGASPEPYPGLTRAWTSRDAATWRPIPLSHPMTDELEGFWVVPDGVIVAGRQSFWFGSVLGE